jgi:hypothetical protein
MQLIETFLGGRVVDDLLQIAHQLLHIFPYFWWKRMGSVLTAFWGKFIAGSELGISEILPMGCG